MKKGQPVATPPLTDREQRLALSQALPNTPYDVVWAAVEWLLHNGYAITHASSAAHEECGPPVEGFDCLLCERG